METRDSEVNYINEYFEADSPIPPDEFDELLADGWRHFGTYFCRYNLGVYLDEVRQVLPLRVRIPGLVLSKSQKRVLRRNRDLNVNFGPPQLSPAVFDLFDRHKHRFEAYVPESLFNFVSRLAGVPTDLYQLSVYREKRIVAASFFDCGETSSSSIYTCFDPAESSRSLGIFCMLKTIEWSAERKMSYYYPGYAYVGPSFYDYKKRFTAMESFDWQGNWTPIEF